jgi:hypothetical protein
MPICPPISRIEFRIGVRQGDIVVSNRWKRFSPTVVLQPAHMERLVALYCAKDA